MTPTTAERSLIRSSNRCFTLDSAAIERSDGIDHLVQLRAGELGIDGQRQDLLCRFLRLGALPFPVAEIREARLQVERKRIVDRRTDTAFLEKCLQLVAAFDANR